MKRPDRALDGFYYIKSLGDVKAGKGKKRPLHSSGCIDSDAFEI